MTLLHLPINLKLNKAGSEHLPPFYCYNSPKREKCAKIVTKIPHGRTKKQKAQTISNGHETYQHFPSLGF
jgi:hypothetical protein